VLIEALSKTPTSQTDKVVKSESTVGNGVVCVKADSGLTAPRNWYGIR